LFSRRRGETEYGVKAFPLGGYVKIAGMNPYEEISPEDYPRTYGARPPYQRAAVIVAGPITHFVIAFILFAIFFAFYGQPTAVAARIGGVAKTVAGQPAPAAAAGLRAGDEIVSVDGVPRANEDQFLKAIKDHPGEPIRLVVDRDGRRIVVTVTPAKDSKGQGKIGVLVESGTVLSTNKKGVLGSFVAAGAQIGEVTKQTVLSLGKVFGPEGIGRMFNLIFGNAQRNTGDAVGSIGVASAAGQITQAFGFGPLIFLLAGVNVFVGILNLLPLPPFDGGHLAVVAWEKIRGRKVDARKLVPLTMVVVVFLMVWFVGITYLDIFKPVHVVP
jgi:RIP metalloprotease RseP